MYLQFVIPNRFASAGLYTSVLLLPDPVQNITCKEHSFMLNKFFGGINTRFIDILV